MNWLKRARREMGGMGNTATAETAERDPTPATANPRASASIGSNGSSLSRGFDQSEILWSDFEERAAIMEFDGGLSREHAEGAAWMIVYKNRHLH